MAVQRVSWSEAAAPCCAAASNASQTQNTQCVAAAAIQKVNLPSLPGSSQPDAATCDQAAPSKKEDNQTAASTHERLTSGLTGVKQHFWKRLELLELKKLCHHCMKHRWQHARVPVCVGCQPQLGRISCRHCGDQVFEHRLLAKAKSLVAATVCLSCAKALMELGLPTRCDICCRWSAFGSTRYCRRCTEFTSLYGAPTKCMRCGINAAFHREPEKMSKVGNQLLCFVCTVAFKKEKYNEEKRKRRGEEAHVTKDKDLSLLPSPSCAFCAKERKRVCSLQCDLMNEKKRAELLAQQVNRLEEDVKQKKAHLTSVISQIEREHLLVPEKLQVATDQRILRDENRVTQLLKQVSDLDRAHAKEVALLIEGNQEERQKLNELIEKIQAKHQTLQAEVERQRTALEKTTAKLKEERKAFEQYKAEATQRVEQASQNFQKIIKKQQERLQAAKKTIRHLKQRTAQAERSSDVVLPVSDERNAEQSEFLLHCNDHEDSTALDSVSSALYELLSQPPSITPNCDTESAAGSSKRIRWSDDEHFSSSDAHSRWPTASIQPFYFRLPAEQDGQFSSYAVAAESQRQDVTPSTSLRDVVHNHTISLQHDISRQTSSFCDSQQP